MKKFPLTHEWTGLVALAFVGKWIPCAAFDRRYHCSVDSSATYICSLPYGIERTQ